MDIRCVSCVLYSHTVTVILSPPHIITLTSPLLVHPCFLYFITSTAASSGVSVENIASSLGFFSSFLIAHRVVVITKHDDDEPYLWELGTASDNSETHIETRTHIGHTTVKTSTHMLKTSTSVNTCFYTSSLSLSQYFYFLFVSLSSLPL